MEILNITTKKEKIVNDYILTEKEVTFISESIPHGQGTKIKMTIFSDLTDEDIHNSLINYDARIEPETDEPLDGVADWFIDVNKNNYAFNYREYINSKGEHNCFLERDIKYMELGDKLTLQIEGKFSVAGFDMPFKGNLSSKEENGSLKGTVTQTGAELEANDLPKLAEVFLEYLIDTGIDDVQPSEIKKETAL